MSAYYNEHDPFAAGWLRNLITAGHIPAGDVDERSIVDVCLDDLRGYDQCHFFAGIGGWPLALRMAGWADDRPVWTGSCPCQPFSAAGKGRGAADERHLWPAWFDLIRASSAPVVLGEQVSAAIRHGWLDAVFDDLEGEGYACGALDLPACSVGAPHIRNRLWFVGMADTSGERHDWIDTLLRPETDGRQPSALRQTAGSGGEGRLADADGWVAGDGELQPGREHGQQPQDRGVGFGLADANDTRSQGRGRVPECPDELFVGSRGVADTSRRTCTPQVGWDAPDWLYCRDGSWRPVESGSFPLAHGLPEVLVFRRPDDTKEVRVDVLRFRQSYCAPLRAEDERTAVVRALRDILTETGSSSRRRESLQQRSGELGSTLHQVPSGASCAAAEIEHVRRVWHEFCRQVSSKQGKDLLADVLEGVGPYLCEAEMASRVGRLRGYGNAIAPQVAAKFIEAVMEII